LFEFLAHSKRSPPIVAEPEAAISDLLSKHPILFHQELEHESLMLVHPAGQRRDEE
jgi:hypothetical protein